MTDYVSQALSVFMGLFAVMNPIANTPVFLGLTEGDSDQVRRRIARRALLVAFVVVTVFCLAGSSILTLFGITLPAFQITGGIVVFGIGFKMLQGEQSRVHNPSKDDLNLDAELEVAISPLAVPILSGPGTITTAMSFVSDGRLPSLVITIGAFLLLCVITYLFFAGGERFIRYIGRGGVKVVTRFMGLILAVIGTQMLIEGIRGVWH
ncbi:MAG: MarC family protein [Acidobacteriota bacterium]